MVVELESGEVVSVKPKNLRTAPEAATAEAEAEAAMAQAEAAMAKPEPWAAELEQLTDMGFASLLGVPALSGLLDSAKQRDGYVDMERVVAEIIRQFESV